MKKIVCLLMLAAMVLCLFAGCGSDDAAETAEAAAPAVAQDGGETSGEPSGEASGEIPAPDFYAPTDAYAKDFDGYRQYVTDAFATDPGAPDELKETYNETFKTMEDDTNTTVQALIDLGLICSYQDFLNY